MIELDHIAICGKNHYETTIRLSRGTGLGNCNEGYFPKYPLGQFVIPPRDNIYFEIEGLVDHTRGLDVDSPAVTIARH